MNIGVLTGGGDCPGLNAAIRAVVKRGLSLNHKIIGFNSGWRGVRDADYKELAANEVRNVLNTGGTMLGTDRFHPNDNEEDMNAVLNTISSLQLDAIICIGGDGTTFAASEVAKRSNIQVISIPKTIDNDVAESEYSIGHITALNIATEAIDRLHTTAESHHRIMVVEVMGRSVGWIAVGAGMAGGAEIILTPEQPFDIEEVCAKLKKRHDTYAKFSIVVVAEGAVPKKGTAMKYETELDSVGAIVAGSIGYKVQHEIEKRLGIDTRVTVLGHVQRGGRPAPFDRNLASRMGVAAVDAIESGKSHVVTCLKANKIELVSYDLVAGKVKAVPQDILDACNKLIAR